MIISLETEEMQIKTNLNVHFTVRMTNINKTTDSKSVGKKGILISIGGFANRYMNSGNQYREFSKSKN